MELALCLSGGGYRAALYHLGVLTILNELRLTGQSVMLDHVHTITSISGGALTGMRFVISEAEQIDRKETFKSIYCKKRSISTHPKRGYPFTFLTRSS